MAYGTIKIDTITFTDGGVDKSVSISGLVQNPTFSGNVTVTGTLSGVTVTGTTANFTSGNFTNISGGTHTITSGVFASGSAASPSITFTGDLNTGIYSPGADQVAISTNGTGRLFVNASGLVGIGTASPGQRLTVGDGSATGVNYLRVHSANSDLLIGQSGGSAFGMGTSLGGVVGSDATGQPLAVGTFQSQPLLLGTNNTERARIDSSGRLLVGTSSAYNVGGFQRSNYFASDDNEHVVISAAGGFGPYPAIYFTKTRAATPGAATTAVADGDKLGAIEFYGANGTDFSNIAGWITCEVDGQPFTSGDTTDLPGRLVFSTTADGASSPTERMRIASAGNVGIGTTSPARTLQIQATSASFGISNTGGDSLAIDPPTGGFAQIDVSGANALRFNTNGSERARIDSSGRLGLGTSSPQGKLHVKDGYLGVEYNSGGVYPAYATYFGAFGTNFSSGGSEFDIWNTVGGGFAFRKQTAASTQSCLMYINSSGNVGIGTTSPGSNLHVKGGTNGTNIRVEGSASGDYTYFEAINSSGTRIQLAANGTDSLQVRGVSNHPLAFFTNDAERARIDSSGRLLVGTSSAFFVGTGIIPSIQLEGISDGTAAFSVKNNQNTTGGPAILLAKSRGTTVNSQTSVQDSDILGQIRFAGADGTDTQSEAASIKVEVDGTPGADDMPGRLVFSTTADGASSPTERMRLNNTGVLSVYGNGDAVFARSGAAAGTASACLTAMHSATSTTTGTTSLRIYTNGNVENTNNSYGAFSDAKLKENIVDATSQWSDIKALQVRKYNFKEGQTHTQIGLVAQEVELVSPGLVSESPDRDAEGNDLGTTTKSVNYSVLYMKAVKALQEAMERIEQLEAKVAALESA